MWPVNIHLLHGISNHLLENKKLEEEEMHHHHIFVYYVRMYHRSCHAQLSHAYHDNCTLLHVATYRHKFNSHN